jgi:predicted metal-dependent hydrolase
MVRKLLVDLSQGLPRHWLAGKPFRSQYFNALSMSFPVGEQEFIDAVRAAAATLPADADHIALQATIEDFVGQEATHRRIHDLYNEQLEKQGLVNHWQHWVRNQIELGRRRNVPALSRLAVTAAFEHCTAVLADITLHHPEILQGADPMLAMLWRWHAVEETEHKAVAFDLYRTLGGSHGRRVRWYMYAMWRFTTMATGQTINNLRHDRMLFNAATWLDAASFFFGRYGLFWLTVGPIFRYIKRDFHPWQHDNRELATAWLKANADHYSVVRGPTEA